MTDAPPKPAYRHAFWRSRDHLWLALLTLGIGFATGEPLGLLVGAVAYALGHVFLPDTARFRKKIDDRALAADAALAAERTRAFEAQRTQLLSALSADRRRRQQALATVCNDITAASTEFSSGGDLALSLDTRLRKLDELLWTYLRLLTIEQSLEVYLETERREQLPQASEAAAAEIAALEVELAAAPKGPSVDTRRKLLASRRERHEALQQRMARVEQARANHDLARSEQERLVEQAKLIRADAVAHKNAEALGARIDISIEHLAETNRWLSELSEFKDLTNQLPAVPAGAMQSIPSAPRSIEATEKN